MNCSPAKILVEAYECAPAAEHAPGATWQILSRLAAWFDIWVLVEQTQYQQKIEQYMKLYPEQAESLHFAYVPLRRPNESKRKRPALPIREICDYWQWQEDAYRCAMQLNSQQQFDLTHHLRSNTFRAPGLLWKLNRPFVWGPMGGSYCVPTAALTGLPLRHKAEYMVKNAINAFQFRFSPTVRQAVHRSAAIFAQTSADQYNLLRTYNKNAILLHEQAADLSHGTPHRFNGQRFLNIAWIGRCIAGKAMELLLRAAAQTRNPKMLNLHLIGDGPELPRWKALAQKLGIAPHCSWYGWLDQSRTNDILNSCDLLAFTSLLEGTPATVIKSLSLGVPVMCLNHCGPADVVTNTCGSLIPVGRPQDMESHMAIQLDEILVCPERIEQWSRNALRQAEKYTWEAAAEQIRQVYLDCLEMAPSAETICVG